MIQPHNRHISFSVYISALAVSDTFALAIGKFKHIYFSLNKNRDNFNKSKDIKYAQSYDIYICVKMNTQMSGGSRFHHLLFESLFPEKYMEMGMTYRRRGMPTLNPPTQIHFYCNFQHLLDQGFTKLTYHVNPFFPESIWNLK